MPRFHYLVIKKSLLQETISVPLGNFQRLKGSYIILATSHGLYFQVFEHFLRLRCVVHPPACWVKIVLDALSPDS